MSSIITPKYRVQQWMTFARSWWLYDARWQCAMKSAERLSIYLEGRHKPIYSPLTDCGDYVVVMNSRHLAMEDELWKHWTYFWHTGYPGRLHKWRAWQLHEEDPTRVLKKEIYRRLPKSWSRQRAMARLFVFPDTDIPEDIMKNISDQIRQTQPVPKRLDEFSQEEIDAFPRIADLREDHTERYVVVGETAPTPVATPTASPTGSSAKAAAAVKNKIAAKMAKKKA